MTIEKERRLIEVLGHYRDALGLFLGFLVDLTQCVSLDVAQAHGVDCPGLDECFETARKISRHMREH